MAGSSEAAFTSQLWQGSTYGHLMTDIGRRMKARRSALEDPFGLRVGSWKRFIGTPSRPRHGQRLDTFRVSTFRLGRRKGLSELVQELSCAELVLLRKAKGLAWKPDCARPGTSLDLAMSMFMSGPGPESAAAASANPKIQ